MNKSDTINELATALAKAQGQIKPALKDSSNPFFKSNYADLASVWDACRKPLSDNGLSILQTIDKKEEATVLETTLLHSSGQFITSTLKLNPKEETPQAIGSAITYARRYALSAMVGICADEDDDGEASMGRGKVKPVTKTPQPTPKPTPVVSSTTTESTVPPASAQPPKDKAVDQNPPDKITPETQRAIVAWGAKDKSLTPLIITYMQENFNKAMTGLLTEAEGTQLLNALKEGKIKKENKNV